MRKNQLITLTTSLLLSSGAFAADLLTVTTVSGQSAAFDIDAITKVVFDDSSLNIVSIDSEGTTYAIDEIKSIVFGQGAPSAVETLKSDKSSKITVFVSRDCSNLNVKGWNRTDASRLEIFGINGALMMRNNSWRGEQTDISALPSGIYVVRIGNITAKIKK